MNNAISRRSMARFAAVALVTRTASAQLGARIYNVRDYGAQGDGKTLDTAAAQAAIDKCTQEKGGTVLIPAGDFLVGTIELARKRKRRAARCSIKAAAITPVRVETARPDTWTVLIG
jgi:uncharacterized RDD family membrane protein YckC